MWFKKLLERNLFDLYVIFVILIYVIAAASVSLHRYWQFDAFWYELGLYNSAIWKVANFQLPIIEQFNAPEGRIIFADHFNPSLFLFSPIYWFTDKTEAILIAQAAVVGAGAFVAYLIAKKLFKSRLIILALLASYLGYVGLQNALYTDFHDTTVATFFAMMVFWAIFNKRWRTYWIFLLIVLGFKESMAGLGAGIGAYLILKKDRQLVHGAATIIVSIIWFLVVTKIVIPAFSGGSFTYEPEIPGTIKDAVSAFFIPLELKARAIFFSFLTFGFAPLFSVALMPAIVEHFAERFVFSYAATRWDLGLHYNATLSPLLFIASLPAVSFLLRKNARLASLWAISTLMVVFYLHRFYLHGPLLLAHHPVFYEQTKRAKFLADFEKEIPRGSLIMTQNNIAAHLSMEKVVLINNENFEIIRPEVVVLDLRGGQNANDFFPATYQEAQNLAAFLEGHPDYQKSERVREQLIFVRKH